jgi:hypothetical protein
VNNRNTAHGFDYEDMLNAARDLLPRRILRFRLTVPFQRRLNLTVAHPPHLFDTPAFEKTESGYR